MKIHIKRNFGIFWKICIFSYVCGNSIIPQPSFHIKIKPLDCSKQINNNTWQEWSRHTLSMEHVCLRLYTSFCVIFVPSGERSTDKKLVTSDPCKKYFLKAKEMGFLMIYYTWNSSDGFTFDKVSKSVQISSSDPLM